MSWNPKYIKKQIGRNKNHINKVLKISKIYIKFYRKNTCKRIKNLVLISGRKQRIIANIF